MDSVSNDSLGPACTFPRVLRRAPDAPAMFMTGGGHTGMGGLAKICFTTSIAAYFTKSSFPCSEGS